MTTTPVRFTSRRASPQRWQAALQRALDERLALYQISGSGQHVVTSGSDATTVYATDGHTCECPAGTFDDPVCKHRALYWHLMGVLDFDRSAVDLMSPPVALGPDPFPTPGPGETEVLADVAAYLAATPPPATETCAECRGRGIVFYDSVFGANCWYCFGTGSVPASVPSNVVPFPVQQQPRPAA